MNCKEFTIGAGRTRDIAADKTCHDFTDNCDVILGLRMPCRCFNAELLESFAQPRKRASVERARQIVRSIRQEHALTEPGKQIEILSLRACRIRLAGGLP